MRALDVLGAEIHHHAVGMSRRLLVDGVNQVEGVSREMSLVRFRFYPDGKEFGAQIPGLRLIEADVPVVAGISRADVEPAIEEALRRIGMRIDDQRRLVNLSRALADCFLAERGERQ